MAMASPSSLTNFNVNGVYGSKPLGYGMVKLIPSRSSPSNNVWKQKAKLHGRMSCKQQASARASYDGGSGRGHATGDFVAGLVLGGAIFGTLGYVFAPQISRSLMSIDKSMFTLEEAEEWWLRRKLPKPLYDEKDLELSLAPRGFGAMVRTMWYQSLHPGSSLRAGGNAGIAVFVRGSYGQGRAHRMGAHPAQSLDCGAWWDVMILVGSLH